MESGSNIEQVQQDTMQSIQEFVQRRSMFSSDKDKEFLDEEAVTQHIIQSERHICTDTCRNLPQREHAAWAKLQAQHLFLTHIEHEAWKQADRLILMRNMAKQRAEVRSQAMLYLLETVKGAK